MSIEGRCVVCGIDRGIDRGGISPSGPNIICEDCYASAANGRAIVGVLLAVLIAVPVWALVYVWWTR